MGGLVGGLASALALTFTGIAWAGLGVTDLRVEYLSNPEGIDALRPRLSWRLESDQRGAAQTAWRVQVASSHKALASGVADLWDSGIVASAQTVHVPYGGRPLASRQRAYWRVRVWDQDGRPSAWSPVAVWSMGLLEPGDWQARWISFRDNSPVPTRSEELVLPPARHYARTFAAASEAPVRRATLYFSALGLAEMYLNGQRVGDGWFEPGWSDYHQRAYYRTHDVTALVRSGQANVLGVIVADGWYAGYVGYGLLAGLGPNRSGRAFYGKTPALLAQLEIEYADGVRQVIGTDDSWRVTADGPIREADLIMGEAYDARRENPAWCLPEGGPGDWRWQPAILAEANGPVPALFYDNRGARQVDLGFRPPGKLQAYPAPPIRITQELPARQVTESAPGVYIFDLGQNFAGVIRLRVTGPCGQRLRIRYGEMLHPDGRLMTENLRKARATGYYTLRGDPDGETWTPRFTYHGFRYVEIIGLGARPDPSMVTGLVLHNDTPLTGQFACSDEVLTRFWRNTVWTQRANFMEVPTDCPQRDERLGWMGDAQIYVGAAARNADVAAFFTKWLDDVQEAQLPYGAYPDYCPYPMGHGTPGKNFGTAWMDAGIIVPWTLWREYGDTRVIERHWDSMTRFMQWRRATTSPEGLSVSIGNPWGDWLNLDDPTPVAFIDTCYHALDSRLMAEMAEAIGRPVEAQQYRNRLQTIRRAFAKEYVDEDGRLKVDSQTAHVLTLAMAMLPPEQLARVAARLEEKIAEAGGRMTTGFLGSKPLLPVLSRFGRQDLAVRLFQSRQFPSWGYEVVNGATTVWERWDSYTREHGFEGLRGNQNASMNSFCHYAFGAVTEWMFRDLAGIRHEGPGYRRLVFRPDPPSPAPEAAVPPIDWVQARQETAWGRVAIEWRRVANRFECTVNVPPNVHATVLLPGTDPAAVTESGRALPVPGEVRLAGVVDDRLAVEVASGLYRFEVQLPE